MMGGDGRDGQATLMDWARDARVRSAACAAQAHAAAESAAAIGEQVDRIIERAAERNPKHAKHLRALIVTAASQRTAIADQTRGPGAGRPRPRLRNVHATSIDLPGRLPDQFIAHDRAADGELQDTVIQAIFAAALTLQDAAGLTTEPEARWRIDAAVSGLDDLIRGIRDTLFNSAHR